MNKNRYILHSIYKLYKLYETDLAKESHSEEGAQQSLACVHDLCHFAVCTMQCVIQVGQFLSKEVKKNGISRYKMVEIKDKTQGFLVLKKDWLRRLVPQSPCASHKWGLWACRCQRWARNVQLSTARQHTPPKAPLGHPEEAREVQNKIQI